MKKSELKKIIYEIVKEALPKKEAISPDISDLLNKLREMMQRRHMNSSDMNAVIDSVAHNLLKDKWKKSSAIIRKDEPKPDMSRYIEKNPTPRAGPANDWNDPTFSKR